MAAKRPLIASAVVVLFCVGCWGDKGPARYTVDGTVTLDGNALPDGEIIFHPTDGAAQPDAGRIEDGRFRFQSLPGKKRVEIRAERDHPTETMAGADPGTRIPVRQQYIPARYNDRSELDVEVKADGSNTFDFPLQAK